MSLIDALCLNHRCTCCHKPPKSKTKPLLCPGFHPAWLSVLVLKYHSPACGPKRKWNLKHEYTVLINMSAALHLELDASEGNAQTKGRRLRAPVQKWNSCSETRSSPAWGQCWQTTDIKKCRTDHLTSSRRPDSWRLDSSCETEPLISVKTHWQQNLLHLLYQLV